MGLVGNRPAIPFAEFTLSVAEGFQGDEERGLACHSEAEIVADDLRISSVQATCSARVISLG